MPGVEFGEGVGADDEDEAVAGMEGLQGADGIDSVGFSGAVEFDGEGVEAGLAGEGEAEHGEAIFVGSEIVGGLVRRHGAGNEPDGVEGEQAQCFAGDGKMSLVDGIERAAEESDGAGHQNITGSSSSSSSSAARGAIWPTTTTGMSLSSTQYSRPRMETPLPT